VSTTAVVTDAAPTVNVDLTFANAPSTVFLSVDDTTTNGISSVGTPTYDSTKGSFAINFKSPANLKPADYSDTLTVLLCSDVQCKVVLASQPLQVTYTVKAATGSTAPSVTLDSTTQSYSALYIQYAPSVNVNLDPTAFTFANFPGGGPNVTVSAPTTGGVGAPAFVMKDATHGGIQFTFAPPRTLTRQTYTTPVTVNVCIDPNCVNLVQSFTLTVNYTVTNKLTVAGDDAYVISAYPVAATLLASNPNLTRVLAVDPSSIRSIDPTTGTSTLTVLALSESPNDVALADDGTFLYVNGPTRVLQVQTSTLTAGYTIPAAIDSIAVQPGHPQTVVLGSAVGMQIFDSGHARANALPFSGYSYGGLAWTTDPAVIGVLLSGNTQERECSYAIDANGFVGTTGSACVSSYFNMSAQTFSFTGGIGYGDAGGILKESDWTIVGNFPLADSKTTLFSVLPDSQTGRAFALATNFVGACNLQSFDLTTTAAIATVPLPMVSSNNCQYFSLVRWGTNGLAVLTPTDVVVISGKFVAP
jgi:hypothetical protein